MTIGETRVIKLQHETFTGVIRYISDSAIMFELVGTKIKKIVQRIDIIKCERL